MIVTEITGHGVGGADLGLALTLWKRWLTLSSTGGAFLSEGHIDMINKQW